jgi:hypothetical protein
MLQEKQFDSKKGQMIFMLTEYHILTNALTIYNNILV